MKEISVPIVLPRWYQDLSVPQMQNVFALGDIIRADYVERVTGRTQRALSDIGVTSTFVKITAEEIKKIRQLTDLDPVKFLCEIYRCVAGKSFVDEEYKKVYDCNERIILSAIAFLTLPETVIELHRRIPMRRAAKLPPKPVPGKIPPRRQARSPYLEPLFVRPNWLTYKKDLEIWMKLCQRTAIPKAILPPSLQHCGIQGDPKIVAIENVDMGNEREIKSYQEKKIDKKNSPGVPRIGSKKQVAQKTSDKTEDGPQRSNILRIGSRKQLAQNTFDKTGDVPQRSNFLTFTERQNQPKPLEEKVSKKETDHPKREHRGAIHSQFSSEWPLGEHASRKSWLGEKDTQLIIAGSAVNQDSSDYPVSLETSGLAYVTPDNSDESFFAALSLDDSIRKTYPRGRENLSRKWQEWLRDAEEDYMSVEKEANKILKSFEKTLKLMGPKAACDSCCACRQTRKANIKYHKTKMPHIVIDSIAVDEKQNKYVVGSLAMNSPAPSPSQSTEYLPEVIASHDKIIKNRIISGVTNEMGETTYYVAGVTKHIEHVPKKIVSHETLPKSIKNVPPCGCSIEKTINEGLTTASSDDNIPWTKNQQLCIGRKYRPEAGGAYSCQEYPGDKSCRRNPFKKDVDEEIKASLRVKENAEKDNYPPEKRNMYSIAEFQPCGDEDGMAVCGGPWGAVNIPDEEEIARRAAEEKMILESPPCGDKPGRSICGAPFGTRHPVPKKPKKDDDEEEEEEEIAEEDAEERKKRDQEARKKVPEPKIEKLPNRDPHCSMASGSNSPKSKPAEMAGASSERKARRSKIREAKKEKNSTKVEKESSGSKYQEDSKAKIRSQPESSLSLQNSVHTRSKLLREKSNKEVGSRIGIEDAEVTKKRRVKEVKDQWNKMKRMAKKFAATPSIPAEEPGRCKREVEAICDESSKDETKLDEESTKEGPFGWRTKSEQELPPEKTLVYLVEPAKPVERVPVRPGGKPCKCRENRNAKKKLLYGVSGMTKEEKGKRGENLTRVIDGLIYITPAPSVRNSDEYIPEYELYDSPYEKCAKESKNDNLKYIERYLGPKSLMSKKTREPCSCSSKKDKGVNETENQELKEKEKLMAKDYLDESAEKRSTRAFEEKGLVDFYSRCRDNVPCWLRCAEFSKDGSCTYGLQVKKPVCECKYERKIVKREEEKKNWLCRQARLKDQKKLPYSQVAGLSRPMRTETNFVISEVRRNPREDDTVDDIEYCVSGITQDRVMGPAERILTGVGMHTPLSTPDPSKGNLNITKEHRHWSPMDIHGRPKFSTNAQNGHPETDKRVENVNLRGRKPNADNDLGKSTILSKEVDKKVRNLPSVPATIQRSNEATRALHGTSAKKSATKLQGETDKISIRKQKSTGSIFSRDGKVSHNKVQEDSYNKTLNKQLLKIELEKMANEGFLFAKLHACWQFPQLQYWLMYRKGIALPPEEKAKLMVQSFAVWNAAEKQNPKKVRASLFEVPQEIMDNWNFDEADKIKCEIALKKTKFLSDVRKLRVLQARNMWGLMEFGKFPGLSFKKAYFTYQASKESDGFVFKPWENK